MDVTQRVARVRLRQSRLATDRVSEERNEIGRVCRLVYIFWTN